MWQAVRRVPSKICSKKDALILVLLVLTLYQLVSISRESPEQPLRATKALVHHQSPGKLHEPSASTLASTPISVSADLIGTRVEFPRVDSEPTYVQHVRTL